MKIKVYRQFFEIYYNSKYGRYRWVVQNGTKTTHWITWKAAMEFVNVILRRAKDELPRPGFYTYYR